jgi:hypothetical protein
MTETVKPDPPRFPRRFPDPGEFERMVCDAINVADNDGTIAQLWDRAHREPEIDEERLWNCGREILKHIYTASLARQMDPRGVLAVQLARAICSIPPYVTIPGIVSSRSSLDLHVALAGPSGGGKSGSVAVAKEAVAVTPEPDTATLGSGEGIAKAYAYRDSQTRQIVTITDTLLFCDTEIESVEALSKRNASPLMSQWRKTFTGERLGFQYADPNKRIPVLDHKYRYCQILGIQPELAGWLLQGIQLSAGTPQRLLWAPVIYPDMPPPEELPLWPGRRTLPGPKSSSGSRSKPGKFLFWVNEVDKPADEKVLQDNELQIPPEIETEIREARHRLHIGETDELSTHGMLTMLKVAAGFMWLDGRTDKITDEDCELARIVMAISDRTRTHTLAALSTKKRQEDTAIGKSAARRELAKAGVLEKQRRADIERVIARIIPRLAAADEKNMSGAELRKTMRDVPRDLFDETMAVLADEGRIVIAEVEYHGQTGWKYTLIEDAQQTC